MTEENQRSWGPIGDTVAPRIISEYGDQFAIVADEVLPEDTIRDFRVCAVIDEFLDTEAEQQTRVRGLGIRNETHARYDSAINSVAEAHTDWTTEGLRTACIRNYDVEDGLTEAFLEDLRTIEDRLQSAEGTSTK